MIEALFGCLFIFIGLVLIFIKKKDQKVTQGGTTSTNAQVQNIKQEDKEKKIFERDIPLNQLYAPVNFPKEVAIYFGSQTGTAEKFAKILEEEAYQINGVENVRVLDFENFTPEEFLSHKLIIVCAATHYEGDPCDNTKKFYKWFNQQRKIKDNDCMKGIKFIVLGLGDSTYEQYNFIGKLFNSTFEEWGGERIFKYGETNAEGNQTEDNFNEWKVDLWKEVINYFTRTQTEVEKQQSSVKQTQVQNDNTQNKLDQSDKQRVQYPLIVEYLDKDQQYEQPSDTEYDLTTRQYISSKDVKIKEVKQLRQNQDEGSTLEITYDLKDTGLTYKTATNLAIFPENDMIDVEACAKRLNLNLDQGFVLKANPNSGKKGVTKHPLPSPLTVREALLKFIDLRGRINKRSLKQLAEHCTDQEEKQRLIDISDSKDLFHKEIEKQLLGVLDLLFKFPSLQLTLEALIQIAPSIIPRYYTIASSNVKYPDEVKIAISLTVDEIIVPVKQKRMGLTSRYLNEIAEKFSLNSHVTNKIFIKDSLFKLPADQSKTPIIMVGPGTGVVPFIGFMQERDILKHQQKQELANSYLFFGCRKSNSDFIYKDAIAHFQGNQTLTQAYIAFSRDFPNTKTYVQDLMQIEKELIIDVLEKQNGNIYLCGNLGMGQAVQSLLKSFIGESGFDKLKAEKRFMAELWGN